MSNVRIQCHIVIPPARFFAWGGLVRHWGARKAINFFYDQNCFFLVCYISNSKNSWFMLHWELQTRRKPYQFWNHILTAQLGLQLNFFFFFFRKGREWGGVAKCFIWVIHPAGITCSKLKVNNKDTRATLSFWCLNC